MCKHTKASVNRIRSIYDMGIYRLLRQVWSFLSCLYPIGIYTNKVLLRFRAVRYCARIIGISSCHVITYCSWRTHSNNHSSLLFILKPYYSVWHKKLCCICLWMPVNNFIWPVQIRFSVDPFHVYRYNDKWGNNNPICQ